MGDIHIGSSPGTANAAYNAGLGFGPASTIASYAATVGSDPTNQGLFSNYNYGNDGVGLDAAISPFSGAYNYALGSGYGGDIGFGGMPFMGMGFGMGGNPIQQMQQWTQYNTAMIDMQTDTNVHRLEQQRYAETKMQGPVSVVNHHKEILSSLINEGRFDQVFEAYSEYKNAIRKLYPPGTDESIITSVANEQFPVAGALSTSNPFLENVTKGLGFGIGAIFTSGKDSRDVRSEITGVPTSFRDKLTKYAGWATGALLTLGAVMLFRGKGLSKLNPTKLFSGAKAAAKAT